MSNTNRTRTAEPSAFDPTRRAALVSGVLYLVTFAASIPAVFLLGPILNNPSYVIGSGADMQIGLACVLDMVNALAAIGTAVAVFSVVKRQQEGLALGFVATRLTEAAIISIGVVSLLGLVSLRQEGVAAVDAGAAVVVGRTLVSVRDWTFLLGPVLMAALNALMFGTLLYRARLVPRAIPALGLIGAPVAIAFVIADHAWPLRARQHVPGDRRRTVLLLGAGRRPLDDLQGLRPEVADRGRRHCGVEPRDVVDAAGAVVGRHRDRGRCGMTAEQQHELRTPPRFLIRTFWTLHRTAYRLTGGRFGLSQPEAGERFGFMRLNTVGRRSGKARVAIVGYFEDGSNLVTLAMNGWGDAEPAWWLNLQAAPDTTVGLSNGTRAGASPRGDWARARAPVDQVR